MKLTKQKREDTGGFTPTEMAHAIILEWIRRAHDGETNDLPGVGVFQNGAPYPPGFTRATQTALRRLHAKLLEASLLDGVEELREAPSEP
mgnify:CR=1 FL=1|jgi:hypothetical protein